MIPLSGATVRRVVDRLAPWRFDRLYGAIGEREVLGDAAAVVRRSADRYIEGLEANPG